MVKQFTIAVCLIVITGITNLANAANTSLLNNENARVYTVFFSVSKDLSNKILSDLENKCKGIEFVGKEIVSFDGKSTTLVRRSDELLVVDKDPTHWIEYKKNESILQNIINSKSELDGLIMFIDGFSDSRYIQTELPTIIVDCSPPQSLQIGFKNAVALAERYGTKFITAAYKTDDPVQVSKVRLNDLAEKVKLFYVINKMKNAKIISIQDHDGFNRIDQGLYESPICEYDLNYPKRLKEYLGVDLKIVRSGELIQEMEKVEKKEAEKIADMWINEATEIKNVERQDIVRAAKLYVAHKVLLKKYDADAITFDSATLDDEVLALPPLTIMELSKEYIPSCCQSHIDCQVTQLVGNYMTGGSGFAGDFLNDWEFEPVGERPEDVMIVGHCGAPLTPLGHDRITYLIRDHVFHQEVFKPLGKTGTAITVEWPLDEVASIVKFDVYRKKASVFSGTVIDGNSLYIDFPNRICRNKIVIKIDDPENCYMLPSNPDFGSFRQCDNWDSKHRHWGGHQVAFYGNLRQGIKNLATLIGFEVIDKDNTK